MEDDTSCGSCFMLPAMMVSPCCGEVGMATLWSTIMVVGCGGEGKEGKADWLLGNGWTEESLVESVADCWVNEWVDTRGRMSIILRYVGAKLGRGSYFWK